MVNGARINAAVRDVVKRTDENQNTMLLEVQGTLRNMSKITSNISTKGDVGEIADTFMKLEKDIRILSINTSKISSVLPPGHIQRTEGRH
jgi:hypothetical protein